MYPTKSSAWRTRHDPRLFVAVLAIGLVPFAAVALGALLPASLAWYVFYTVAVLLGVVMTIQLVQSLLGWSHERFGHRRVSAGTIALIATPPEAVLWWYTLDITTAAFKPWRPEIVVGLIAVVGAALYVAIKFSDREIHLRGRIDKDTGRIA